MLYYAPLFFSLSDSSVFALNFTHGGPFVVSYSIANEIKGPGAASLAQALQSNRTLTTLNLGDGVLYRSIMPRFSCLLVWMSIPSLAFFYCFCVFTHHNSQLISVQRTMLALRVLRRLRRHWNQTERSLVWTRQVWCNYSSFYLWIFYLVARSIP